jgi:hypothetical protein
MCRALGEPGDPCSASNADSAGRRRRLSRWPRTSGMRSSRPGVGRCRRRTSCCGRDLQSLHGLILMVSVTCSNDAGKTVPTAPSATFDQGLLQSKAIKLKGSCLAQEGDDLDTKAIARTPGGGLGPTRIGT